MATPEDLLASIDDDSDLCDLGYEYAEIDHRGYCLWVVDCAQHLFPLARRHLTDVEIVQLMSALDYARDYLDGRVDAAGVREAILIPRHIDRTFRQAHGQIPFYLSETLDAVACSLELVLPDAQVYHEDVIYAATRAAFQGRLHDHDSADGLEESDCNMDDELAGSQQSHQETQWQLNALKRRLQGEQILFDST